MDDICIKGMESRIDKRTGLKLYFFPGTAHLFGGVAEFDEPLTQGEESPALPPAADWVGIPQASRQLMTDVDGMGFEGARGRIMRAIAAGKFQARGEGRDKRIHPIEFKAWRLDQREANLSDDSEDDDDYVMTGRR